AERTAMRSLAVPQAMTAGSGGKLAEVDARASSSATFIPQPTVRREPTCRRRPNEEAEPVCPGDGSGRYERLGARLSLSHGHETNRRGAIEESFAERRAAGRGEAVARRGRGATQGGRSCEL